MRSIYYLFSRFYVLILFVVLEFFALSLIFKSHKYQEVKFLNTTNGMVGTVLGYVNGFNTFIHLGKNNKALVEENALLKKQIQFQNQYPSDSNLPRNSDLYTFDYVVAKIENNSINKNINYITINKGSKDGLQKGLGVISSNGVVGIITNVSENFALVMSVISVKSLVGVRHKNSNALGNLRWNGGDPNTLQIDGFSKTIPVKKNDTIVTAGFSSIFPPNVLVATVKDVKPDEGSSFYDINVHLTNNISSLSYVYVVKNNKKNE
ncbi:MAG TPA: rod shape-determining protein MreC, partial [Chitinophagales bacterium]|nr:rod shape-determining protein MreC [Chitinophagales bacterium]